MNGLTTKVSAAAGIILSGERFIFDNTSIYRIVNRSDGDLCNYDYFNPDYFYYSAEKEEVIAHYPDGVEQVCHITFMSLIKCTFKLIK